MKWVYFALSNTNKLHVEEARMTNIHNDNQASRICCRINAVNQTNNDTNRRQIQNTARNCYNNSLLFIKESSLRIPKIRKITWTKPNSPLVTFKVSAWSYSC